jgi:hypothetical protein
MGIKEFGYFICHRPGWDDRGRRGEAGAFVWKASGADFKGDFIQGEGTVFLIR